MDVLFVDLSLALLALGLACLVRPLHFLGIRSRRAGALLALAGATLAATGLLLPVTPARLAGAPMAIDAILPAYQFGEHHEIEIQAPPDRVMEAVRAVTAREIHLFRDARRRERRRGPSALRRLLAAHLSGQRAHPHDLAARDQGARREPAQAVIVRIPFANWVLNCWSGRLAGPFSTRPLASNWEPWQGQT